jgi:hypothetical protein
MVSRGRTSAVLPIGPRRFSARGDNNPPSRRPLVSSGLQISGQHVYSDEVGERGPHEL